MPFHDPQEFILRITAILFILTVHEYCHAWAAYRLGDPTARDLGRVSLNPLVHLDFLGTVMLLFGPFGWGKPVPVDVRRLRHPVRDDVIVSFAGAGSSLALGILFALAMRGVVRVFAGAATPSTQPFLLTALSFLSLGALIGISLGLFNLLPFFPLDGSHVLKGLVPGRWQPWYDQYLRVSQFVLLAILVAPWITDKVPSALDYTLWPAVEKIYETCTGLTL